MHAIELAYRTAMRAAPLALRLGAPFSDKLRRGLAGRRHTLASLRSWSRTGRDPGRPLVWLHAPSVGEALMAQAILATLREREPRLQSVFTFFSPSAERMAGRVGADWHGYLPWDRRREMGEALSLVLPDCIAFVRTEIWPVLVSLAAAGGTPVLMLNAVLAEGSSRTGRGARLLLGPAYARLQAVGAVSEEDARRLPLLGVPTDRITVTGDARFDQVHRRVEALDRGNPLLQALTELPGLRLVAGSTWPEDEERLVPALAALAAAGARWRTVFAPHEPADAHVRALEARLDAAGIRHARLPAEPPVPDADALIVDRVGLLADLYATADLAYVGGGFGTAGLHSIVEPAALGVPVLYGPRHGNAREAHRLADAGGGFVLANAADVERELGRLARDDEALRTAGRAAGEFVRRHLGGAERNAELVLRAMTQPDRPANGRAAAGA